MNTEAGPISFKGEPPVNVTSERGVIDIWQSRLTGRTDLVTEEGEPVKVIYPGRVNDNRGADFTDAAIATGRGLMRGDIEVHVKSSSWRAHGHHQDPNYNRVIMHVVFWSDVKEATTLENGQKVPTLALCDFLKDRACESSNNVPASTDRHMPCRDLIYRHHISIAGDILDAAGKERFLAKAAEFQTVLAQTEASQCLYEGIMKALGYIKNKRPMAELARRMPLHRLDSIDSLGFTDAEYLARSQALLLGTAGLLPSQRSSRYGIVVRHDEWVDKLEKAWSLYRYDETMSEDDWSLFKVRPNNLPTRRIAAMSHLLCRYRERGLLEELARKLTEVPVEKGYQGLEKALQVATGGYWANHLDLGLPPRRSIPALLGNGRAADITVNIILPFMAAWGRLTRRPGTTAKAFRLYKYYPELAVNTIVRHMINQLRINRYLVDSAQRQQGLIHIYKTRCSQGECDGCPIGKE